MVLAAILMGTRAGGVGVGVWGGLGVAILVFVFQEAPGEPPISAMLIILAVVTSASLMQAAGGIDWMVKVAAGIIPSTPSRSRCSPRSPRSLFSVGAGTSNILYPLLPVIYDVSYKNHIRPSRPLSCAVAQSGMALAASPVSAAMAAMLTLTTVKPYNFDLVQILSITIPACLVGIIVTATHRRTDGDGPRTTIPRSRRRSPPASWRHPVVAGGAPAASGAHLHEGWPELRHRLPARRRGDRDLRPVPRPSSRVRQDGHGLRST